MKKWIILGCVVACVLGCHRARETLTVAATAAPHAEILEAVKPDLRAQGIELQIIEIDDYNLPNRMLEEKQVDANFFQHEPFLREAVHLYGYHIVPLTAVHLEPLGVYSIKYKSVDALPQDALVAIPQDPTNETRALYLLQDIGLIKLKEQTVMQTATIFDITDNPKGIRFQEADAPYLPRVLPDVDLAVVPTNFALQAGLDPRKDALALESEKTPYANVIAVREEDLHRPAMEKLKEAVHTPKLRAFIQQKYHGAILPAETSS